MLCDFMIDTEEFLDMYIAFRNEIIKGSFFPRPKPSSKSYAPFEQVVDKIKEIKADPAHFLGYMVKYYAPLRIFPKPCHLLAQKAISKYRYHQALKNIYRYDDFSMDGDDVFIHNTNEIVSLSKDIKCPINKDIRVQYLLFVFKEWDNSKQVDLATIQRYIDYAIVKYAILQRVLPTEITQLANLIKDK